MQLLIHVEDMDEPVHVVVEPCSQSVVSLAVAVVDPPVCPLGLQGPVEAFDLAVLPGAVRPDREVTGPDLGESVSERSAVRVGPVVVGHHL